MKRPGVMIGAVLGRLTKKPVTVLFPFEESPAEPGYRGMMEFDIEKCISCSMCAKDCPSMAIVMEEINEKNQPVFNLDRCMFCGQCEEVCPKDAIKLTGKYDLAHLPGDTPIVK